MPASTERIVVSHAGALQRPDALQRLFGAGPGFQDAIDAALPGFGRLRRGTSRDSAASHSRSPGS